MKSGQVTEYNKKDIFFNRHAENDVDRIVTSFFLRDKKN